MVAVLEVVERYCSTESAIFEKVDRTLASCNLNRMRGRKPQNLDY